MFEAVDAYLEGKVSPERKDLILGCLARLEAYNLNAAVNEIVPMIESATDTPFEQILLDIDQILNVGMDRVLGEMSITMNTDSLMIKDAILDGLKVLEDFSDHGLIVQMCDASDDEQQTLCELLELVTEKTWSDYAEVIASVNPALITRIADIHRKVEESEEDDVAIPAPDMTRQAMIMKFFKAFAVTLAKTDIQDNATMLGTPVSILLTAHMDKLHEFDPRAPKQAAIEIVGLALISDLPNNDLIRKTKELIDDVYADINFITQVDVAMDDVFKEVAING